MVKQPEKDNKYLDRWGRFESKVACCLGEKLLLATIGSNPSLGSFYGGQER